MKILQNCWTVNEKRLGVCCRLNNEDYLDYDEEQIQIDYDNEHEKSDRKTVIPAMLPSQSITSHGKKLDNAKGNIPLFLILTKNEFNNVENMKNKRIKDKLRIKVLLSKSISRVLYEVKCVFSNEFFVM